MANRLEFSTSLDGSGFARGIRDMERLAGISGGRMSGALAGGLGAHGGPGGGVSGVIRESLVIIREFGRGNYTRIPGSATLLAQYLGGLSLLYKSTASSAVAAAMAERKLTEEMALAAVVARDKAIASKAAAVAVEMDGAASVIAAAEDDLAATAAEENAAAQNVKALASERAARVAMASSRITVTAFGWIAIAAIALAVPVYLLWNHFNKLAKAHKEFADSVDASRHTFLDEAKAAEENRRANEQLDQWLKNELSTRKDLKDITEERIEQLHQETQAQVALMRASGDSAAAINQYEMRQLRTEQQILQASNAIANSKLAEAEASLKAARSGRDTFATHGLQIDGKEITPKAAQEALDNAINAKDTIYQKLKDNPDYQRLKDEASQPAKPQSPFTVKPIGAFNQVAYGMNTAVSMRDKMEREALVTGSNGMSAGFSLQDLNAIILKNQKYLDLSTDKQNSYSDAIDDSKKDISAYSTEAKKSAASLVRINKELEIRGGVGAQTAALEDAKKSSGKGLPGGDALVRVGNFLGTSRSGIENLAAEHVKIAREQLGHLRSMDSKIGHGGTSFSGT